MISYDQLKKYGKNLGGGGQQNYAKIGHKLAKIEKNWEKWVLYAFWHKIYIKNYKLTVSYNKEYG